MFKQNKWKNLSIATILLLVIVVVYMSSFSKDKEKEYSVVYLTTGEVYIGELSNFPTMKLKNGYLLAVGKDAADPQKTNFQLNPLSETLWAPKYLYLNKDQVSFYGPILKSSKVGQTLSGQEK